jgi:hypothetical protein
MSQLFDELSKSLADESLPRRESVRRLGLAIAATILAPLGFGYARAGHHSKPPKPPKPPQDPCKAFCTCRQGRERNQCLDACKACNKDPGRLAGSCGYYVCCEDGQVSCGDYCTDVASDPYNCGACGNVCSATGANQYAICVEGNCDYACNYGTTDCDGTCVSLDWDTNNCGACGNVCGDSTPYCAYGTCAECWAGSAKCDGNVCTDLYFDSNNCGSCGNVCPPYTYCYYGSCYYPYYGGGGYGGWGGYYGGWW